MKINLRFGILITFGIVAISNSQLCFGQSAVSHLVISQVYGGGGNTGATYTNDFIELFNPTSSAVPLFNWSVQYSSATGAVWDVTPLSATIAAGGYYLIKEYSGGATGMSLPTADATGTTNLSATDGKVALCSGTTALTGSCPTGGAIVDFVGYGGMADCYEGSAAAPSPSNTKSIHRANNGCTDINNNTTDFATAAPDPRNSSSAQNNCALSTNYIMGIDNVINIFPNPSHSLVTIITDHFKVENVTIEIYNMLGEKVYGSQSAINYQQSKIQINLSFLNNGLYWIMVRDGEKIYRKAFTHMKY